jgi:hypothetical protein
MERPDLKQVLGRLLGPAGPDVGCEVCREEHESLRALVSGEQIL